MKVKVCGLTREEDVERACELGAWACGFVLAPSPRRLDLARAARLREAVLPGVLAVGVFADASRDEVLLALRDCRFDLLQFHGRERPEDCLGYPVPVIKALPPEAGLEAMSLYAGVERFLVEPPRARREPETLRACWRFAAQARGRSIILAGGLTPENVREAATTARPFAVDVSSGVESAPGVKDAARLEAFFLNLP